MRSIKPTHVGFRAHVKIASRIVSYRIVFQRECSQRKNWLSTNRPSFAAAISQVATLTRVIDERVVQWLGRLVEFIRFEQTSTGEFRTYVWRGPLNAV